MTQINSEDIYKTLENDMKLYFELLQKYNDKLTEYINTVDNTILELKKLNKITEDEFDNHDCKGDKCQVCLAYSEQTQRKLF